MHDDDLPPGVFREPGTDRLLVRSRNTPDHGTLHRPSDGGQVAGFRFADATYEWRPDTTETVAWHEAYGRVLPDGDKIASVHRCGDIPYAATESGRVFPGETIEVRRR